MTVRRGKRRFSRLAVYEGLGFIAILVSLVVFTDVAQAATFTVNTTDDVNDGTCNATHCSLREAINAANANAGTDTIAFNIPGAGPHTIQPASVLPNINTPMIIDGYTQPGASPNTNPTGALNTVLKIELNGINVAGEMGLHLTGGNSTVRGLVINRFGCAGMRVISSSNVIEGNFIGTDVTGTIDLGNGGNCGITLGDGIGITNHNNPTPTVNNNIVGGTTPGARNLISGNQGYGISLFAPFTSFTGTVIRGNLIGTQIDGVSPLGNGLRGITICCNVRRSTITSNTIAHNGNMGIGIQEASYNTEIRSNSIFANALLGIDLGGDGVTPNDTGDAVCCAQNYPVLTSATSGSSTTIQGTFNSRANRTFALEFFSNSSCDPSGYGEGQTFIGTSNVTTDGSGNASFNVPFPTTVPVGQFITATATDLTDIPSDTTSKNTSEFSQCIAVTLSPLFRIERATGNAYADGSWNPGGADLAERVDVSENVEPGDVVELDPAKPKHYRKTRTPYSSLVAGVISTKPGIIIGHQALTKINGLAPSLDSSRKHLETALPLSLSLAKLDQGVLVLSSTSVAQLAPYWEYLREDDPRPLLALLGRAPVKATTENGPIRLGDLLVSSSRPGYAMRCSDVTKCEGAIIGKALEALEQGVGVILVLIMR